MLVFKMEGFMKGNSALLIPQKPGRRKIAKNSFQREICIEPRDPFMPATDSLYKLQRHIRNESDLRSS